METHTGHLFDLGPDGLGFIAEEDGQIWAFRQKDLDHRLADSALAFAALDGSPVQFAVEDRQIRRVDLSAAAANR